MDRGRSNRGERYDCVLLKAAASMCFFGFFQSGELTVPTASAFDEPVHLEWGDVAVDDKILPASVRIHLKALKCDQLCTVYVGKTGTVVCPVNVMLQYVAVRGPLPGLFFRCEDGAHLTKAFFYTQGSPDSGDIGPGPPTLCKTLWLARLSQAG